MTTHGMGALYVSAMYLVYNMAVKIGNRYPIEVDLAKRNEKDGKNKEI